MRKIIILPRGGGVRTVCAAAAALLLLTSCAGPPHGSPRPGIPADERGRDDLVRSAQLTLVNRCLSEQGLTVPAPQERPAATSAAGRRLQAALFGTDPRELSLTLPTGYTVTANTDGCLARAQRTLYGDQKQWFEAEVVVNNLHAEAQARLGADPEYRAALARRTRCTDASPEARPAPSAAPTSPAAATPTDRCDRESGLAEVRARLEPALLAAVRAERRADLTTYQRLRTAALRHAVDLTSSSTPAP
ncbi:hypothetical protein [Streptomyces sp. NPDC048349]|uniref:hypothetical protein n=1 Tax=Streptomyces sp. NPDC048349 TaxID=3155486 RepID=UPI0034191167